MNVADRRIHPAFLLLAAVVVVASAVGIFLAWRDEPTTKPATPTARLVEDARDEAPWPSPVDASAQRVEHAGKPEEPDPSTELIVRVLKGAGETPIRGAQIDFGPTPEEIASSTRSPVVTQADGVARIAANALGGWLLVECEGFVPEFAPARPDPRVESRANSEVIVRLEPLIQQPIVVRDQAGRPVEGAVVQLRRSWGSEANLLKGPKSQAIRQALVPTATTDADGRATVAVRAGASYPCFVERLGYIQKATETITCSCDGDPVALKVHEIAVCAIRYPRATVRGEPVEHDMGMFLSGSVAHGPLMELGSDQGGYDVDGRLATRLRSVLAERPGVGRVDRWRFAAIEDGTLDEAATEDVLGWKVAVVGAESNKATLRFRAFREFEGRDVCELGADYEIEEPGTLVVRFVGFPDELMDNVSWLTSWEVKRFGSDMHEVTPIGLPPDRRPKLAEAGVREFRFRLFPAEYMVTSGRAGSGTHHFDERRVAVASGEERITVIQQEGATSQRIKIKVVDEFDRERRAIRVGVIGRGGFRLFNGDPERGLETLSLEKGKYRMLVMEQESDRKPETIELQVAASDEVQEVVVRADWGSK